MVKTAIPNSGKRANRSGHGLEYLVQSHILQFGFEPVPFKIYQKNPDSYANRRILLIGAPYTSIYGHNAKSEFVLVDPERNFRMRIECKWQATPGSVDEKFPYLYLNAIERMPEPTVMLIIDGGGAKPFAIDWLRTVAQERRYISDDNKTIIVTDLAGFINWMNRHYQED